jgi:hypothetical protein
MAIQIQGNGGVVAEVDGTTYRALRVTSRPLNYGSLGAYKLGMASGTMAVSLVANSELFQFRWPDATNLAVVYRVNISAGSNVAASTAALLSFNMAIARSFGASGSGGTRAVLTGNISKLRTSMGTSLVNDAGISTTTGLGAGTKTIDHATSNLASVSFGIGTGAITTSNNLTFLPTTELLNVDSPSDHPIVFAQNEGFIIRNGTVAFPAGMTWTFSVNTSWIEAAAF